MADHHVRSALAVANRVMEPIAGRAPWWALLETLGRRTGHPRRTPISDGLEHGRRSTTFWAVAEHGTAADWVQNARATRLVRLRTHGQWRAGTATILPGDDVAARLATLNPVNALAVRAMATNPVTVRVDLEPAPGDSPLGTIGVDGIIAAPVETVFDFLADLSHHDWIGSNNLHVAQVHDHAGTGMADGAEVVLDGPGLPTMTATTTIQWRRRPDLLTGRIEVDDIAAATITWELAALGGGTRVRLTTRPLSLRVRDRAWLRAGGRHWLATRYDDLLVRLARRLGGRG